MSAATIGPTPAVSPARVGYGLLDLLVSQGGSWKGSGSGSGGAYSATGSVFTQSVPWDAGTNGFGNSGAWGRVQLADGTREVTVQHSAHASIVQIRIKASLASRFTSGSPSATVTPSAADETLVCGSGTDGSPTYYAVSSGDVRTGTLIAWADKASPYGFWLSSLDPLSGYPQLLIYRDPCVSTSASDPDPYVWSVSNSTVTQGYAGSAKQLSSAPAEFSGIAVTQARMSTSFVYVEPQTPAYLSSDGATWNCAVASLGVSHPGRFVPGFPCYYSRNTYDAAPKGPKGIGTLFTWKLTAVSSNQSASRVSANDSMVLGDCLFVWNGTRV